MRPGQSVATGSSIILKIGGQEVGRAQSIDGRRDWGTEGVYELGSIMPKEHVHNRYNGTATLERYFVAKKSLAELGFSSLGEEVLQKGVIDIEVIDKSTGKLLRAYRGCTINDSSENFRVGAISGENATFSYLEAVDEKTSKSSTGANISVTF